MRPISPSHDAASRLSPVALSTSETHSTCCSECRTTNCRADGERYGIQTQLIAKSAAEVTHLAVAVLKKLLATCEVPAAHLGGMVLWSRIVDIDGQREGSQAEPV